MKSFDEMADDYVDKKSELAKPIVLTHSHRQLLMIGYLDGLAAGIEFRKDSVEKQERGL